MDTGKTRSASFQDLNYYRFHISRILLTKV